MDPQADFDAMEFIIQGKRLAKELGAERIELGNDFFEYKKRVLGVRGKVSEHFDIDYVDTLEQEGTWFICEDANGAHIANHALRFEDLRGVSLETALLRRLRRIHGGAVASSAPVLERFSGRAVYAGDMWIAKAYRSNRLAPILGRIAQAYAFVKWRPEIMYGIMTEELVHSGYGQRLGYSRFQRYGHVWDETPDFPETQFLIWNELEDLRWQWNEDLEKLAAA